MIVRALGIISAGTNNSKLMVLLSYDLTVAAVGLSKSLLRRCKGSSLTCFLFGLDKNYNFMVNILTYK